MTIPRLLTGLTPHASSLPPWFPLLDALKVPRTLPKFWQKNGWTGGHLLAVAALVSLGVVVTGDAWLDIARIAWKDEEASHILLVPIIAVWLVWVRSGRLRRCRPTGLYYGPLLIALGALLYFVGSVYLVQAFWHVGAVVVVLGCAVTVLGKDVLFQLAPAVAVLIFLAPVPGRVRHQIAIPLEVVTAQATQLCCEVIGFSVERMGNVLRINGRDVAIEEACNGLRMIFALTLVSYAFAFSNPLRGYVRFLVLAASPFLAVACNVARLVPTVWFYGYEPTLANQFHDISGWLMLPFSFLILLGIIWLLRWALIPVTSFTLAYD